MSEDLRPPTETPRGGQLLKWLEPLRSNVACPPTRGVKKERKICWIVLKRKEITITSRQKLYRNKQMENPGIDPGTSRMQSEHSTNLS